VTESMYSVYCVIDRTWYRSDVVKKHKERLYATKTVVYSRDIVNKTIKTT